MAELGPGAPSLHPETLGMCKRLWGGWVFVSGEQEDIVSWGQGGLGDQKELLGCLG